MFVKANLFIHFSLRRQRKPDNNSRVGFGGIGGCGGTDATNVHGCIRGDVRDVS